MADEDERSAVRAAIDAVAQAYANAAAKIAAMGSAQVSFEEASRLSDLLDELDARVSVLKALMVERIWKEDELKLTPLGKQIGVSKQRVSQILKIARQSREGNDG